jgi:glycosyltransferase involved in cell wall biosynthesis
MKICIFTENYYKGGLDTFLVNIFNTWPEEKDELTLCCNSSHAGLKDIKDKTKRPLIIKEYNRIFTSSISRGESSTIISNSPSVTKLFNLSYKILQYPFLFPWYLISLTYFFIRNDFDRLMVVNGGYPASLICRCASIAWSLADKRPLAIMNFHNSSTSSSWYNKIAEDFIDRLVIKSSKHIISVSKDCLDSLKNRSSFLDCDKTSYIYNGIEDPVLLNNFEINKPRKPYCLMLATYEPRKGHTYLLKAFKDVVKNFDDVQLKIFGHGRAEKQQVFDEVSKHNLMDRVILGDFEPQKNQLIANASILVVPSQAFESFGLTIIEAMAFGVPVVTTDVGGMPEVLGDSNAGYVCSKDNYKEFALAIETILDDSELASTLGKNGRAAFEDRFSALTMSKKYYELIKN